MLTVSTDRSASSARKDPDFADCARAFEEELDFVYRALLRHGVRRPDVEDLAQDVFIVMWRRWADYDQERPLRAWLAGIAMKVAYEHHRKRSKQETPHEFVELPDGRPRPDDQLASVRARHLVLRALAELPAKHRALIVLHELDEIGVPEIATMLDLPKFTVYSRLRRARRRFAQIVRRLDRPGLVPFLTPEGLVELERSIERAPEHARRSIRARLRALASSTQAPRPISGGDPPAGWPRLGPGAALALTGLLALVVASGVAIHGRRPGHAQFQAALPGRSWASAASSTSSVTQTTDAASLARGLVGDWRFEDGPGSRLARDRSGHGNHCSLRELDPGAAWIPGAHGGGVSLAQRGWLECPQPQARAGTPVEMTVAAWVDKLGLRRNQTAVVTRQLGAGSSNYFSLGFGGDDVRVWSGAWTGWIVAPLPAPPRGWVHLAFTHSPGLTKLFIAGRLVGQKEGGQPRGVGPAADSLLIGAARYGRQSAQVRQHLDGAVDDVLIYDRALSDEEIQALASGLEPQSPR
jgi:RNA polymerase sigma factor (sigma-70 family)